MRVNRSALVPFSALQMFYLVDEIESYSQFLPWCKSTKIIDRQESEVTASIDIAKAGLNKTFTTRNFNSPGKEIKMTLVDGPFKQLDGAWVFESLNETACKVNLNIEFEFSNKLMDISLGPIFGHICNSLVDSFVKRAKEIHGK